jgi:signal transduction histidine kinase
MQRKVLISLGDPRLMDITMYAGAAIMALLSISIMRSLVLQIAAMLLCLAYALLYAFLFRTGYYERQPAIYFGPQAVIVVLLYLLKSDASDIFNLLFYSLTVQAAVVLHIRSALAWTVLYFLVSVLVVLLSRGAGGFVAVLFFLAAFVFCVSFGHALQQSALTAERNKRLVDELQDTQQKLRELAVVDERNRLARDLHDSVKQQVFAISMQLSAARTALSPNDKAYASVMAAEQLAQQAGAELTTLINALRPPALENKTLADAMRDHLTTWSRQTGIAFEAEIDPAISVDPPAEHALFRVLQEALANVARHSQARQVQIILKEAPDGIELVIEDNGVGYDPGLITRGVGLDSMKERLAAVSGALQVSSPQSHGTRLVATVKRS